MRPHCGMSEQMKEQKGMEGLAPLPGHSPLWNQSSEWQDLRFATSCSEPTANPSLSESLWQLCNLRNGTVFPLSRPGWGSGSIPITLGQGWGMEPDA